MTKDSKYSNDLYPELYSLLDRYKSPEKYEAHGSYLDRKADRERIEVDAIKGLQALLEQTRTNTIGQDTAIRTEGFDEGYAAGIREGISMAVEALPKKQTWPLEEKYTANQYAIGLRKGTSDTIDQMESNLKALIGGDNECN